MYRTILTVAAVAPLARGDYSYSYDAPWAVAAWLADPTAAGATYGGPIAAWNTSGVTNMRTLFCGSIFYCLSWPGAASFQHGPAYQRVLPAIGDPEFVGVHLPDGIGQLVPIGMVGNDQG